MEVTTIKTKDKPIFIVGYPKSGTTLMCSLMDGHSELMVLSEETQFFPRVFPRIDFDSTSIKDDLSNAFLNYSGLRYLNATAEESSISGNLDYTNFDYNFFINKVLSYLELENINEKSVFDAVIMSFAEAIETPLEQKRYWVEKTPRHYEYVDRLLALYPDARFIHVVRDPRDNWVSYNKKRDITLNDYCYNWLKSIELGNKHKALLGEHYHFVKYEDLVKSPEQVMKSLCESFNMNYQDILLLPTRNGVDWHGNSMWNERPEGISNAPVGRYKERAESKDVEIIEAVTKRYMKAFGYSQDYVSAKSPLSLKLYFLKKQIKDLFF